MTIESVLFVGDTHCGATTGLWPAGWLPGDEPYTGARYLWGCWQQFVDGAPEVDLLVLTGDLIDGPQRKAAAVPLHTAHLGKQAAGAIEVLRPLAAKASHILRVDGTPYHEDFHNALAVLDSELGVDATQQVFDLQLDTGVLNVGHHPPGGAVLYMGTKLDRQILWNLIQSADGGPLNAATWIVRAHLHEAARLTRKGKTIAFVPCWKLQDEYAAKGNFEQWQPSIGSLLMLRDRLEPSGYRFIDVLYDTPRLRVYRPGAKGAHDKWESRPVTQSHALSTLNDQSRQTTPS